MFVDFKGGAAFAELAGLPHAAGMITNLQHDLSLVDRMHAALFGEQQRRQSHSPRRRQRRRHRRLPARCRRQIRRCRRFRICC